MNNTHLSTNDHHAIDQLFEKATSFMLKKQEIAFNVLLILKWCKPIGISEGILLQRNKKDTLEQHMEANYFKNYLIDFQKNMIKGLVSIRSEISDSSIWFILTFKFTTQ